MEEQTHIHVEEQKTVSPQASSPLQLLKKISKKRYFYPLIVLALLFIPVITIVSGKDSQSLFSQAASVSYTAGVTAIGNRMDSGNKNMISSTQVTTGANAGLLASISVYIGKVNSSPSNHMQVAIYADNGSNAPGALLGSTSSQILKANAWNSFPLSNIAINGNTKYWLAFNVDGKNTQYAIANNSLAKSAWKSSSPYGSWANPFGTPSNRSNEQYSIYMTYSSTTAATPAPTTAPVLPTATPTPIAGGQTFNAGFQTQNNAFDSGNNNMISATHLLNGSNSGALQSISIYMGSVDAAPVNHMQVALYSDNGANAPGTLLASSQSQVVNPTMWNVFPLSGSVTINPNTEYWLAFNLDGAGTQFGWATNTGLSVFHSGTTFGTWPATFGTVNISTNQAYAIYMTYSGGAFSTPTPVPSGSSPYTMTSGKFYVNPNSAAAAWVASHPGDSRTPLIQQRISSQAMGFWFGYGDTTYVTEYINAAAAVNKLPIIVSYGVPDADGVQDNQTYRASTAEQYVAMTTTLAQTIGTKPVIVILDPDSVLLWPSTTANETVRINALSGAIKAYAQYAPNTWVYMDGTDGRWTDPSITASRINKVLATGARPRGVSINVSNYNTTAAIVSYYNQLLPQLSVPLNLVVDTSRNGNGPNAAGDWCNPGGRALGVPSTISGTAPADALLWVKLPGTSDGLCGAYPNVPSGEFDPQMAIDLINN
jgi:endoglucanase